MTGQLKCQKHHIMLKVARDLWYCDKCDYFTGGMQHLKGVCEEARRLVRASGGIEAIRTKKRIAAKRVRERNRELALARKEMYDQYGYYDPVTHFSTASGEARCKDCGGRYYDDGHRCLPAQAERYGDVARQTGASKKRA